MGKFKTPRQKMTAKAAKPLDETSVKGSQMDVASMKSRSYSASVSGRSTKSSRNIFEKLDVDIDSLTQDLEVAVRNQFNGNRDASDYCDNFDVRSTMSSKSLKGLGLKKKDKEKLRHEVWSKKVELIETHIKEIKEEKKRKKTPVTGDMKPLLDALPVQEWLNNSRKGKKKQQHKPRSMQKQKVVQKDMLEGMEFFQTVYNHPKFKADPFATITEHLKNTMDTN